MTQHKTLSRDAEVLAYSFWAMTPSHRQEFAPAAWDRVTPRARAALTRLAEAGLLSRETDADGTRRFLPTAAMRDAARSFACPSEEREESFAVTSPDGRDA